MNEFLIVAAVRIQTWLVRTPSLKLIRGGSAELKDATADKTVKAHLDSVGLGDAVKECPGAADVDGVVAWEILDGRRAGHVERTVVAELRRRLPGLEWVVWRNSAENYMDARSASLQTTTVPMIPTVRTVPFAEPCAGCGAEPASEQRVEGDSALWLGRDCLRRWTVGGNNDRVFVVHRSLNLVGRPAPDFKSLAAVPGRAEAGTDAFGAKKNHLALIAADGNGVGRLFDVLAKDDPDGSRRAEVSKALKAATEQALWEADLAISDRIGATIAHLVGGDDVLVSVPAHLAWTFAVTLGRVFDDQTRGALGGVDPTPSLGVGMVFHPLTFPFAQAHTLAERCLAMAKAKVKGAKSAICWFDLTSGVQARPDRPIPLDELPNPVTRDPDKLPTWRILTLPPAARTALRRLLEATGDGEHREQSLRALVAQAHRNQRTWLEDEFVSWLQVSDADSRAARMLDQLDLARWWPTAGRAGEDDR